jgi:hypothetical protein
LSARPYRNRFGSLLQAYRLAGYEPERDYRYIEINRDLQRLYPQLVADVNLLDRLNGILRLSADAVVRQPELF